MIAKSDIYELKSRLDPKNLSITRLKGAYMSTDAGVITRIDEKFLALPEEEFFKYLDIAKEVFQPKALDNKNLELQFASESSDMQKVLSTLVASELKDEDMLEVFYQKLIEENIMVDRYMVLLFHDCYDVPKRTSDGNKLDESEEVYEHIICAICPVQLDKPGLQYDGQDNCIRPKLRNWVLQKPAAGFVYPAFEGRTANMDKLLYFCAKPQEPNHELMDRVLECKPIQTAAEHQETFEDLIHGETQSAELTEDFLGKMNAVFEELLLEEQANCSVKPKRLTDLELLDIAIKAKVPEFYAERISRAYGRRYSSEWPKLIWLYNQKLCTMEHEKQHKDRMRSLLARAGRALDKSGQKDLAEEIDRYLERSR